MSSRRKHPLSGIPLTCCMTTRSRVTVIASSNSWQNLADPHPAEPGLGLGDKAWPVAPPDVQDFLRKGIGARLGSAVI
jgi:hypothetical protein